ncbi:hypothetical protein GDO86_008766 [Hymenochirus boettgeri]|uniref:Fucosyltransferase n=1 Tax=Hymenochirus boettgeri TaxID=247094 RepID=A0A8T2J4D0_9PIPI|nr:hypothetical protein GDO86_008766 [Hymenochirus boettgeri]
MTSCYQFAVFFFLQMVFGFILFSYYKGNNQYSPSEPKPTVLPSRSETPQIILLWTWPFGNPFPLNQCPSSSAYLGCWFTADRKYYSSAKAIVFHHRDVCVSRNQMPQEPRPPGQYWVWFNLESPSHSPNLRFMDDLINITMTYRLDSDIFSPYGFLLQHNSSKSFTIPEKSKLVAWVVSNWNPNSRRVQLYEELKKYIQIDVYGRQHIPLQGQITDTISKYKFYLSFENSIHKDYITEKFWSNALNSGTVPVVLGPPRENYEKFAPRDSFIHVDDFPNAKQLAEYLLQLDKDTEKYQKYFQWRSRLETNKDGEWWADHYCKVCKFLKEAPAYRSIANLEKWYT